MKSKILTLFLISLFTLPTFGQEAKTEITKQFFTYMGILNNKDFNKAMDYMPDELFEIVPKEQMVSYMESALNSSEISFKFDNLKVVSVKEPIKSGTKYYVNMKYSHRMSMLFNALNKDKTPAQLLEQGNLTKENLQVKYGEDNVKFDEKTNWFEITVTKNAFAISPDGKTNWKFIDFDPNQRGLMEKILPKEIIDQF
jgi:hypothetical protein